MVETDSQILTLHQLEYLQRCYLRAQFNGNESTITDKSLESDGRRRNRILKDAVNAGLLVPTNETSSYGVVFRISAEVISSVVPVDFTLLFSGPIFGKRIRIVKRMNDPGSASKVYPSNTNAHF